jgi:ankyrin repeat protein
MMKRFFPPKLGFVFIFFSLLFVGCSSGDPDAELKSALRRAVDIYYGDSNEEDMRPALEQMRQAVANGANPNMMYEEYTPLYLAIMNNNTELAALLIDHGAHVVASDLDQDGEVDTYPALLSAIEDPEEINPEMIVLLIEAGSELDGSSDFQPPLEAAVDVNSIDTVKALLQAGADPNGNEEWSSPLGKTVEDGNIEMFELLRASGAEIKDAGELLALAAGSSNPEMVKRVLPLYAGPKEVPELFVYAAWGLLPEEGEEDRPARAKIILEQLSAAGFKPAPGDFDPVMVLAAEEGMLNQEALETMLSYGASAKVANGSGETCLMLAIEAASLGDMMESEIGPKGMFKHQDTHVKDVVQLLLDHGADVNVQDNGGRTPLMYAATTFNVTAVRLLLEQGADQSLVDNKGKNAEQLMLAMGILKDDKKDTSGRIMQSMFGITPEFKAQARKRAEQIQVEFGSESSVITSPPSPPQDDAKPIAKPG